MPDGFRDITTLPTAQLRGDRDAMAKALRETKFSAKERRKGRRVLAIIDKELAGRPVARIITLDTYQNQSLTLERQ